MISQRQAKNDVPFGRHLLESSEQRVLRQGHWANADVVHITALGKEWVVKDYAKRSAFIRMTSGRYLLNRELKLLKRVQGIEGVPNDAFRVDANAIAMQFMQGELLRNSRQPLDTAFFEKVESAMRAIHRRGVVHLDTRGAGNLMVLEGGNPGIIDFEAGLYTGHLPRKMRRFLEDIDLSGVYKAWKRVRPESLSIERDAVLARVDRFRKIWIFRDILRR